MEAAKFVFNVDTFQLGHAGVTQTKAAATVYWT